MGARWARAKPFVLRALVVLVALASTCCAHPQPGSQWRAITVDGRERAYLLHAPTPHAAARPLVVALHGRAGDGVQMEGGSGLSALADREGFVVAYPNGFRRSWADLRGESPAARAGVDDVAFIGALIDRLIVDERVDAQRVYVTGASNGGMMAFRLACELSTKIAAIAPVIALMPVEGAASCRPAHPMPVMIVAGTDDPLVPFGGGAIHGEVMSARASREWWATVDGCGPVGPTTVLDRVDDGTRVHRAGHDRCRGGAEVLLYAVEGGGHTWPNGSQYLPEAIIGRVTHDLDGANEAWAFFRRHRLAGAPER